jgi:hypothetical protein
VAWVCDFRHLLKRLAQAFRNLFTQNGVNFIPSITRSFLLETPDFPLTAAALTCHPLPQQEQCR